MQCAYCEVGVNLQSSTLFILPIRKQKFSAETFLFWDFSEDVIGLKVAVE
jgi:hypothetical protein